MPSIARLAGTAELGTASTACWTKDVCGGVVLAPARAWRSDLSNADGPGTGRRGQECTSRVLGERWGGYRERRWRCADYSSRGPPIAAMLYELQRSRSVALA